MLSVVAVRENPYWLVKVALLDLLAEVDYRVLHYVEMTNPEFARGQHNFIGVSTPSLPWPLSFLPLHRT